VRLRLFLPLIALLSFASIGRATIIYDVSVVTSCILGTVGSLDFVFNPGPASQAASVDVTSFTSDGTLGSASVTGDVTGTLPATLTFDNLTAFNDYFTGFTFGSALAFQLSFYGPAIDTPDGVATSGSTFTFSMFSDAAGTTPALTVNPNGFAITIDVNLDGSTTLTNDSAQTTAALLATPEPGAFLLLGSGLMLMFATGAIRNRRRSLV